MTPTEKLALAMAWYDSGSEDRVAFQTLIESLLVQPERHELQAKGEHPAPCARHCEANAFQIVIKNLKAQLAQPEQEPVAWVAEAVCDGQYIDGRPRKIWWECKKGVGTAFYTTPPQRTWVGLTGLDQKELMAMSARDAVFATEAKLKEKNT